MDLQETNKEIYFLEIYLQNRWYYLNQFQPMFARGLDLSSRNSVALFQHPGDRFIDGLSPEL
jgi:hypothetical protein